MKNSLYTFLLLFAINNLVVAQNDPAEINGAGIYIFNDEIKKAFDDVLALKLKKAHLNLPALKKNNAFNLLPYYIADYIDFLEAFVEGKPKHIYGKYKEHIAERMLWLEQGDPNNPYFLFTQGDIYLRWGLIYAIYGDNDEAVKSIKKAATLLEKNEEKFPEFIPNRRSMALLHTLVGAMADTKFKGSLANIKGDVTNGIKEFEMIINHGKKFKEFEFNTEVQLIYGMLLVYMGNSDNAAWGNLNTEVLDESTNPMAAYVLAQRSIRTGKSKNAGFILDRVPESEDFHYFAYLDILKGMVKLHRLDVKAEEDFKRFLERYRGVNNIKEAYQRLAWIAILNKKEQEYKYYMGQIEKKGEYNIFADRQAMNEMEFAKQGAVLNLELLQTKLLLEGGYFERAYSTMLKCDEKKLKEEEHKIALNFYKGSVYHVMKKSDSAMEYFEKVAKTGGKKPYYYACAAALHMGQIWEVRKETSKAIDAYKKCLKEKPDQYKAVLYSKANERLQELDKKK